MSEKPFYMSKKFVYAAISLVAAVIVAILPTALELDEEQTKTLNEIVPVVLAFGFALIGGHTIMDALSMAKGAQLPGVSDAIQELIDAIKEVRAVTGVNLSTEDDTKLAQWHAPTEK